MIYNIPYWSTYHTNLLDYFYSKPESYAIYVQLLGLIKHHEDAMRLVNDYAVLSVSLENESDKKTANMFRQVMN
jgi:hypothetical protein